MISESRSSEKRQPRRKVFLAFEGEKTEPEYFENLIEKEEKNNHIIAEIIPLLRGPGMHGFSNPERIVDLVHDYYVWLDKGEISLNLFIERVLHRMEEKTGVKCTKEQFKKLKHDISRNPEVANEKEIKDKEGALEICIDSLGEEGVFMPTIAPWEALYDDTLFFIIVDRDPCSFKNEQCVICRQKCNDDNFKLIVSNPCFELWLLLHFDVKKEEILKHTSCESLKKLLEDKIGREPPGRIFDTFYDNISNARSRLKTDGYCEDLNELLSEMDCKGNVVGSTIGTNIGMLMDIIFECDTSGK